MRRGQDLWPDSRDYAIPTVGRIAVQCTVIDDALVKAGLCWLAMLAARTRLDAVIVLPSLADAEWLTCALPQHTLDELVRGNIVRTSDSSLQLLIAHEVMPRAWPHNVVLSLGLTGLDEARIDRMNPAASFVVRISGCKPVTMQ